MNSIIQQFISFYKRRIAIPVNSNSLVLDIGSGDKPHWRADILLDQYVAESDGIQRSGSSKVTVTKPLVVAPIEKMPFKDKSFDYIICSHIFEHVMDPNSAIKEVMRVGKAGYIEVPFEGAAKVIDVPSHLWYCKLENNRLIFTAKKSVAFDREVDQLMNTREMLYGFAALGQKYWDKFIISIFWENKIRYKVVGKANKNIFMNSFKAEVIHNKPNFLLRNIFNSIISFFLWNKRRIGKVNLDEIIQCNQCSGKLTRKRHFYYCAKCKKKIFVLGI